MNKIGLNTVRGLILSCACGRGVLAQTQPPFVVSPQQLVEKEQQLGFAQSTISSEIDFVDLLQSLGGFCRTEELELGRLTYQNFAKNLSEKYSSKITRATLDQLSNLYRKLSNAQQILNQRAINFGQDGFCLRKTVFYGAQRNVQHLYQQLRERVERTDPRSASDFSLIYNLLDDLIVQLTGKKAGFGQGIGIQFGNTQARDKLSAEMITVAQKTTLLFEEIFYDVLDNFVRRGLLGAKDIERLRNKIYFVYHPTCNRFHGNILIKKTINTRTQEVIEVNFDRLNFYVNLCSNYYIIEQYPELFHTVVRHELGHYIQYFIDPRREDFAEICWRDNISICQPQSFVSDYARLSPEENYAETFARWVGGQKISSDRFLQQQFTYFDQRFGSGE